jgi:lactate dehydrogenase-like 2-hydroxyacid dehydrogenase
MIFSQIVVVGREVYGSTIGILGMGRIGLEIARRAGLGFDMKVLYYNGTRKTPEEEKAVGGAEYVSLEELFKRSDCLVVAAPYSAETRHIVNAAAFELMKPTSILVNISRGGLVDHDALVEALEKKNILGCY